MEGFALQFEKSVKKYSNKTAVIYCDSTELIDELKYNDVYDISEEIKTVLNDNLVPNNICIAVVSNSQPILPSIILGIHKHGSSFMFMDPNDSSATVQELFYRIKLKWILECQVNSSSDVFWNASVIQSAFKVTEKMFLNRYKLSLIQIDSIKMPKIYSNISYVIQTSGTTGENKTVDVTHECIMSNIISFRKIFDIKETDIIYNGTNLTFDPSIIELFLPLVSGAAILMVPSSIKNNKQKLYDAVFPKNEIHSGVTFLQFPPSVFLTFPEDLIKKIICDKSSLRVLALGGEKFPEKILDFKKSDNLKMYNLYGITEMSCWASVENIKKGNRISIGKPLDHMVFQVRNEVGDVIKEGEGELYIGSSTRVCLIDNEAYPPKNKIVFRATGDIVKIEDKSFYYIGRKNSIIKRFGHRVCLLEIEKNVYESTNLLSKCVWVENESQLILFLILKESDPLLQNKIIDKLRIKLIKSLKKFEIPDFIEIIPNIPLTSNGKTDFNTLLKISRYKKIFYSNLKPIEVFRNLFSKYFGMSITQLNSLQNSSFLNLGGNSILAIQIISEFEKYVGTNKYTSDLMGYLMNKNFTFKSCCEFVQLNFWKNDSKRKICDIEEVKTENNVKCLKSDSFFELKVKWKYNMSACIDANPVLIDHPELGKLIVIGSHSTSVAILDALRGNIINEIYLPDAIESAVCPSACKNFVMVGCNDGFMYSLNLGKRKRDAINWKYQTGVHSDFNEPAIKCTPVLCRDNTCIVFGSYDKNLYCLSVKDGTLIWKNEISKTVKAKPVLCSNRKWIFVTTLQGSCIAVCENTGNIKFYCNTSNPIFGSPCLYKDLVLWADVKENVYFKNIVNSQMVKTFKTSGFIFSSLHLYKNYILFGCNDHKVYCLNCDNYESLFTVNIDSQISSTPCTCIVNDLECFVVAGNNGRLHLFDFETKCLLGDIQLPGMTFSSPIVENGLVYIGCRDDNVYCIEIKINK